MKYFNNLQEKIKLQKEVKELAAKIAGEYPINFIINSATKKVYCFDAESVNNKTNKAIKEGNEFVFYSFINTLEFKQLRQYPIKQLFSF